MEGNREQLDNRTCEEIINPIKDLLHFDRANAMIAYEILNQTNFKKLSEKTLLDLKSILYWSSFHMGVSGYSKLSAKINKALQKHKSIKIRNECKTINS